MDKNNVLFAITILGFFGITGLELINTILKIIDAIYLKIGNLIWLIIFGMIYILANRK